MAIGHFADSTAAVFKGGNDGTAAGTEEGARDAEEELLKVEFPDGAWKAFPSGPERADFLWQSGGSDKEGLVNRDLIRRMDKAGRGRTSRDRPGRWP